MKAIAPKRTILLAALALVPGAIGLAQAPQAVIDLYPYNQAFQHGDVVTLNETVSMVGNPQMFIAALDPNLHSSIRVQFLKDGVVEGTISPLLQNGQNQNDYWGFVLGLSSKNSGFAALDSVTGLLRISLVVNDFSSNDAGSYTFKVLVDGEVYVADEANSSIRVLHPTGYDAVETVYPVPIKSSSIGALVPHAEAGDPGLLFPKGVVADANGNVYVADTGNGVIRLITPDGTLSTFAGTIGVVGLLDGTGPAARFLTPTGLAFDSAGNLYVSDVGNNTIRKITPGAVVTTFATGFSYPYSLAIDPSGNVFVADSLNNVIRKVTPAGAVSIVAGTVGRAGSNDGTGAAASFNFPCAIAIDLSGNLFVTDDVNHTIRQVTPAGVVTTFAGTAGAAGSADGTGAAARFNFPFGIAIDASGDLFVTDNHNNTLREITPAGVVTTVAGSPGVTGSSDSNAAGKGALFNSPYQVSIGTSALVSPPATLTLSATAPAQGRLSNLSVRTIAGSGNNVLTVGFFVGGTGTKRLLARAIGPALAQFGVTGVLPDPRLSLLQSGSGSSTVVASNAGWGGTSALSAAFAQVFAFPLPSTSLDSALLTTVSPGGYTAQISSSSGDSGVALGEIYDADTAASPTAQFTNLSALAPAGTGAQTLTAGFVISGSDPETVLIRGIGPGLVPLGVKGTLGAVALTLHTTLNGQDVILEENEGWSEDPNLPSFFAAVGAFSLPANSADAAMAVTLPPGAYTVEVASADGSAGAALIEVYQVPR